MSNRNRPTGSSLSLRGGPTPQEAAQAIYGTPQAMTIIDASTGEIVPLFEIGPAGLTINGEPTFEQWEEFGWTILQQVVNLQWAVGDFLNYGEENFGQRYREALKRFDYKYGTLLLVICLK